MKQYSLYELASVIRSKNSGPFQITLDVLFDDSELYYKIKEKNCITRDLIASLYGITEDMVTQIVFFDPALGFKITFDRTISSGTCMDTDVYGAQQHVPLGELKLTL